jgi:energy-coupling factor transporter ATP-binding protein EcfA2
MAVLYKLFDDMPEPLSLEARWRVRRPTGTAGRSLVPRHMTSSQLERVQYELLRYCRGEIDGVSILIAGQRGAGKTTLAKLTAQYVAQQSDGLIPLPLLLHGPTIIDPLFSSEEPASLGEAPAAEAAPAADNKSDEKKSAAFAKDEAMRQLIAALYRELSTQIVMAWRNAAAVARNARVRRQQLLELAEHADLRLDRAPDPEVLHKIWARAGFLESGVAFFLAPDKLNGGYRLPPTRGGGATAQGLREIVALSACADAFRVILGKTTERMYNRLAAERSRQTGMPPPASGKEPKEEKKDDKDKKDEKPDRAGTEKSVEKLGPPALGTIAAGLALSSGSHDPWLAIGIGACAWLASWLSLQFGTRGQSRQDSSREMTVEVDWSTKRLERDFPSLIRRVKDAGFAPIFILDELDKMDAPDKLQSFLRLAKHIVTDNAAFLFLVNRDYYEHLIAGEQLPARRSEAADAATTAGGGRAGAQAAGLNPANPTAATAGTALSTPTLSKLGTTTFFNHRIFVTYRPEDFRKYLQSLVTFEAGPGEEFSAKRGVMAWAIVLTYRARMLPFDFTRRLKVLVNEEGQFRDEYRDPNLPLSRVYRQELTMQLGIEILTLRPDVRERIEEQPYYAQLIYDTLYLPSFEHEHRTGRAEQPIGRDGRIRISEQDLQKYLGRRGYGGYGESLSGDFPPREMLRFLFDLLRDYLRMLENPARIRAEWEWLKLSRMPRRTPEEQDECNLWRSLIGAIDERPLVWMG